MKNPLSNSFEKAKQSFFAKNPSSRSTSSSRAGLTHRKNFSLKNLILILLKQLNNGLLKYLFIGLIKLYQWTLGPFTQGQCRFYPSCSEYGLGAFKKYGVFKGSYLTIKRILKCNPWHSGGPDPLP